jgi:protein-L-isoaspartate(D-aspartate) O-methyltransferase
MNDDLSYAAERKRMVEEQIAGRGIRDARLLDVMRSVPRHRFVLPGERSLAYMDGPLQIGLHQTISQPYIVALMTELLELHGQETVLEIGTGSGYQAAVLGLLAREVHTVERHAELAERARGTLAALGLSNVHVHTRDGSSGLPDHAPYQAILVTAAAPGVPHPLLEQLAVGGQLVLPVGSLGEQMLERWTRRKGSANPPAAAGSEVEHQAWIEAAFFHHAITAVAFVPLRGRYGWEQDW